MVEVDLETVKKSADLLRDLRNWIAVYEDDYEQVSDEAKKRFQEEIEKIANDLAGVHCVIEDGQKEVSDEALDKATDRMRDFKNWVEVFLTENEVSDEAAKKLNECVDKLAESIMNIKCK